MIKRYLPPRFKQFLWFIFKSPQRKWIGYSSLVTDIRGYLAVLFRRRRYERLTVCVGVKNRSSNLLNFLVESMNRAEFSSLICLSVYDCGSDDIGNLQKALREKWKGRLKYTRVEQPFARSVAFNAAVKQADTSLVLICDADMSLPYDIVGKVSRYTTPSSAWFPVVWYTNEDGSGRYYTESTGMFSSYLSDFLNTGGFDENIREWGKEDWLLFFEFYKNGIACIRSREKDFVHHYHPSLMPADFKPLF